MVAPVSLTSLKAVQASLTAVKVEPERSDFLAAILCLVLLSSLVGCSAIAVPLYRKR
jgi:hypothetical protein